MIKVDAASFVPIYEQIKKEISRLVAVGRLKAHEPLPSIRDLAAEIIVNPNTVARAYRELEQEGLLTTQKGRGSFVAGRARTGAESGLKAHLGRVMDQAIAEARQSGLAEDDILELFKDRLMDGGDTPKGGRHE